MKLPIRLISAFALLLCSHYALSDNNQSIVLERGHNEIIQLGEIQNINIIDPSIVQTTALPSGQLMITANRHGETDVVVTQEDNQKVVIHVTVDVSKSAQPSVQKLDIDVASETPILDKGTTHTYTVVKGDSLWEIAQQYHVTVHDLVSWNNLDVNDFLQPGQTLTVHSTTAQSNMVATANVSQRPSPVGYSNLIEMRVGGVKVLPVPGIKSVAIGNTSVVSTSVIGNNKLLIIAEKKGNTDIVIWHKGKREKILFVNVTEKDTANDLAAVRALIKDIDGLNARQIDGKIVLEGDIDIKDKLRVESIVATTNAINLTKIHAVPKIHLDKMVLLDVKIVEFSKTGDSNLGVDWGEAIGGLSAGFSKFFTDGINLTANDGAFEGTNLGDSQSFIGISSEINSVINLAVESGEASILSAPRLSTRNGSKATFQSGGDYPQPTGGALNGLTVEYKKFGIMLKIEPAVDDDGNIMATIEAEVSAPDPSLFIETDFGRVVGFKVRKMTSVFNTKNGETMVLAGLLTVDVSNAVSKLPFLGDMPGILGDLFRNKRKETRELELVVFVTPTVVEKGGVTQTLQNRADEIIKTIGTFTESTLLD